MNQTVEQKSFHFALQIVKLCKDLRNGKKEFVLSNQLLRSGTSIGANVAEAQQAQSRADFVNKISIALKEAVETDYWLRLMSASDYISKNDYDFFLGECREIQKMLTAIVKTSKNS